VGARGWGFWDTSSHLANGDGVVVVVVVVAWFRVTA